MCLNVRAYLSAFDWLNCTARSSMSHKTSKTSTKFIDDLEDFRFFEEDSFQGQVLGANLSLSDSSMSTDREDTIIPSRSTRRNPGDVLYSLDMNGRGNRAVPQEAGLPSQATGSLRQGANSTHDTTVEAGATAMPNTGTRPKENNGSTLTTGQFVGRSNSNASDRRANGGYVGSAFRPVRSNNSSENRGLGDGANAQQPDPNFESNSTNSRPSSRNRQSTPIGDPLQRGDSHNDGQVLGNIHANLRSQGVSSSYQLRSVLRCLNTITPTTRLARQYGNIRQALDNALASAEWFVEGANRHFVDSLEVLDSRWLDVDTDSWRQPPVDDSSLHGSVHTNRPLPTEGAQPTRNSNAHRIPLEPLRRSDSGQYYYEREDRANNIENINPYQGQNQLNRDGNERRRSNVRFNIYEDEASQRTQSLGRRQMGGHVQDGVYHSGQQSASNPTLRPEPLNEQARVRNENHFDNQVTNEDRRASRSDNTYGQATNEYWSETVCCS